MYKQRCVGAEGPLMPVIFICSCGLILYSATDAGVRALGWDSGAFVVSALIFGLAAVWIHRYTRVEMEYVWFGGELVVRRHENGRIMRFAVRQNQIFAMRDGQGSVGNCVAGRTQNCCATMRGRLTCCVIYYHDDSGRAYKMLLQPKPELRRMLWQSASAAAQQTPEAGESTR